MAWLELIFLLFVEICNDVISFCTYHHNQPPCRRGESNPQPSSPESSTLSDRPMRPSPL